MSPWLAILLFDVATALALFVIIRKIERENK
jgi:hypothetical protein